MAPTRSADRAPRPPSDSDAKAAAWKAAGERDPHEVVVVMAPEVVLLAAELWVMVALVILEAQMEVEV